MLEAARLGGLGYENKVAGGRFRERLCCRHPFPLLSKIDNTSYECSYHILPSYHTYCRWPGGGGSPPGCFLKIMFFFDRVPRPEARACWRRGSKGTDGHRTWHRTTERPFLYYCTASSDWKMQRIRIDCFVSSFSPVIRAASLLTARDTLYQRPDG